MTCDKASWKLVINFLLDDCLLNFVYLSFPEISGIHTDSDTAIVMANLFLYCYGGKWLLNTKKKNSIKHVFLVIRFVL